MNQDIVIAKLNRLLPHWKKQLRMAEKCSFSALRWREDRQTIFASPSTRDSIRAMLNGLVFDAKTLMEEIDELGTATPSARRRVPLKEIDTILHRWRPDWGLWKLGWPGGSKEHLASLGITFDEATQKWFKT